LVLTLEIGGISMAFEGAMALQECEKCGERACDGCPLLVFLPEREPTIHELPNKEFEEKHG
jgi:hypothetical protein